MSFPSSATSFPPLKTKRGVAVYDDQVCKISRRHRSSLPETERFGNIQRHHLNGEVRRQSQGDCPPEERVEVTVGHKFVGLLIIANKKTASARHRSHQGQQRGEIPRLGALADHQSHPQAEFFLRLLECDRLVVRPDSSIEVRHQSLSGEARRMPVDEFALAPCQDDLFQDFSLPLNHPGIIHHFRQTEDTLVLQ
jgi:hypothetical protein